MLNELRTLEQGLTELGVEAVAQHPDITHLLKGDVLRVRVNRAGGIEELELLPGNTRPEIWTLRDGKHNGFPGLKTLKRGLLALDDASKAVHKARWKAAHGGAAKRAEIERLVDSVPFSPEIDEWPTSGHRTRIAERLKQLRSLENDDQAACVPAVFDRFLKGTAPPQFFLRNLLNTLLAQVRDGADEWLHITRTALIEAVPLAIDVGRDFGCDAGDERRIAQVSRALWNAAPQGHNPNWANATCALTGQPARLLDGNFPQPTLPGLGQTYLFSRNDEIPALARYGSNGPSSLPIGADLVSRFSGALTKITAKSQRGKTWCLLPAESGDKTDLFVAFVGSAFDKQVADSFFDIEDEITGSPALDASGVRLLRLWKGVVETARPDERAGMLILRMVDPGNRKAVYERRPTVSELHAAAQGWTNAMANAPDWLTWPILIDGTRKAVPGRPRLQPPLALIPLSRKFYVRMGREAVSVPGVSGAEALSLFLGDGDRKWRAQRILAQLLNRYAILLSGIANATGRGTLKDYDRRGTARIDALGATSWLGSMLFFVNRTKDVYMNDAGFKLGQLLAAADAIHAGYCADVRGGDMPPTLVGNSVFAAAGRNPDKALDVLQTRWKPYHAWATRVSYKLKGAPGKDDAYGWTVRRAISQARRVAALCTELHQVLAQMRAEGRSPDEVFRAELLLGYVSGLRPEARSDETTVHTEGEAA